MRLGRPPIPLVVLKRFMPLRLSRIPRRLGRGPRRRWSAWLRVAWAIPLALFVLHGCQRPEDVEPDIIVILVDTLRADYLGCYGFQGEISPAMDRLALESIVYDNAVAPAPWTKPSVASLFTSLDPLTHRVRLVVPVHQVIDALPKEAWTLAEALEALGYETAAWVANPLIKVRKWGFDQGFEHFHRGKNAGQMIRKIRTWLENRAQNPTVQRPLFLYLHFMDVHGPYNSNAELLKEFSRSPSLGDDRLLTAQEHKALGYLGNRTPWRDLEQGKRLNSWKAAYASGVRLFDDQLGPFLNWLRNSGRLNQSVLLLTSDHGEDFLEHGRWDHGTGLFQHSIEIPLMIRLPEAREGGRRDNRMTGLLDVMPTLLHLAGLRHIPEELEGQALLDSTGREPAETQAWSYSGAVTNNPRLFSIQDRKYKLIWEFPEGAMRLHHLLDDPAERVNLASGEPWPSLPDSSRGAVERKMAQILADRIKRLRAGPSLAKTEVELDSKTADELKSLGYVQ